MSTAPVKSLIDEQLEQIERSLAIIGVGLPRELPVQQLPPEIVAALKAGQIGVRPARRPATSAPAAWSSGAAPSLPYSPVPPSCWPVHWLALSPNNQLVSAHRMDGAGETHV